MDNTTTGRLIGSQCRREEPADVLRSFGVDAIVLAVYLLVRPPGSDQYAPVALGLQQLGQRIAEAATVGKDQPTCPSDWRGQFFGRELFGLPYELIKPVVEIIGRSALRVFAQELKTESLYRDCHLSRIIKEQYVSRRGIRLPPPHARVTP